MKKLIMTTMAIAGPAFASCGWRGSYSGGYGAPRVPQPKHAAMPRSGPAKAKVTVSPPVID
jgi:hypothetical protein